ncbi:MAG: mannitol-1-phosphate 5-dehydrogenase [Oscillospiraceae bacterium]|nr:mannitol-1-phosphate 5-dehydrogenase [Oscillospiraceae bacterium]
MKKTAVHFGAGVIGKGFIADLLYDSGFEIIFVDIDEAAMRALTKEGKYTIYEIGNHAKQKVISPVRGLSPIADEAAVIEEIAKAEMVTTSVWATNLDKVAPMIAKGLKKRIEQGGEKVNVLACENAIRASDTLRSEVLKTNLLTAAELDSIACFANTGVDRMVFEVIVDGVKHVEAGADYELSVEQPKLVDPKSEPIKGAEYTDNLDKYLQRKLYIVNCGHATGGYYGYMKGLKNYSDALDDAQIAADVWGTVRESALMLHHKHGFSMEDLEAYLQFIMKRFQTPGVEDPILRIARSPIRKLRHNDRLVGPALECEKLGLKNDYLARGIAAALLFDYEGDAEAVELQAYISEHGIEKALTHFTGIAPDSPLGKKALDAYTTLKKGY